MNDTHDFHAVGGFAIKHKVVADDEISQTGRQVGAGRTHKRILCEMPASFINPIKQAIGRR